MRRRSLLRLGLASAAVLAAVGVPLSMLRPGLEAAKLSPAAREVFAAVGAAVLEGSLPPQPAARQAAIAALLDRIDALVANLPPHAQSELSQLLSILASAGGRRALAGLDTPWSGSSSAQVQAALNGMRNSSLALKQQSYQALHDIVGGAYFSDASTWAVVGYPGPVAL
jgi:hypothetical protein